MVAKQRIRMANEKHSKNITQRGNVAKTAVCAVWGAEGRERRRGTWPGLIAVSVLSTEERHGGEVIGRSLVTGSLHLRGLRVR